MIRLACMQASGWLAARRAGLSAANALRLEEHLAHCSDCGAQARLLDGLRKLSDEAAQPLPPDGRQRAILQALARADASPQPTAAQRRWLVPSAFGGLAGVAAFVVALMLHPTPSTPGDRVLDGELQVGGSALFSGASLGSDSELATRDGARVSLAHATLELQPGTHARWNRQTRELRLERGAIAADVDPTRHQSFSVATAQFRVLVLGTSFEVTPERVRVSRGRVRVVSASGQTLATLEAGQHWELAAPQPTAAKAAPAPEPAAVQAPQQPQAAEHAAAEPRVASRRPHVAARQPAPQPKPERVEPSVPAPNFDAQLELARQALGRRELPRARALLDSALAAQLQPKQRAEAMSLQAECALVAGDLRGAEAGYTRVADQFAALPAGENAAFAAARLMADRHSESGLARYLARYPQGRFVKEASARLRQLRGAVPAQP